MTVCKQMIIINKYFLWVIKKWLQWNVENIVVIVIMKHLQTVLIFLWEVDILLNQPLMGKLNS